MILNYRFDDIVCSVLDDATAHINNGWHEPHYHKETCEIDFDYEVSIDFDDVFDYITPMSFCNMSKSEQDAYIDAIRHLWYLDLINLEQLEEDEDFIQFMKDRYEDDAHDACREENDD